MYLEPEDGNEYHKNAFLTLPNCTIKRTVIGKRVNHGEGYGLEIPVSFKFLGPVKAIQWPENAVKKSFKI